MPYVPVILLSSARSSATTPIITITVRKYTDIINRLERSRGFVAQFTDADDEDWTADVGLSRRVALWHSQPANDIEL